MFQRTWRKTEYLMGFSAVLLQSYNTSIWTDRTESCSRQEQEGRRNNQSLFAGRYKPFPPQRHMHVTYRI